MRTRYGPGVSIPTTDGAEIEARASSNSASVLVRLQAVGMFRALALACGGTVQVDLLAQAPPVGGADQLSASSSS
jgi:hypothetical protein